MSDETAQIEYFISLCDDLISCKFLVAEGKISRLLSSLAASKPISDLVSECMSQFNREREMAKAFVIDARGQAHLTMPEEEYKIVALVFCTLANIDSGALPFAQFIKTFFPDESGAGSYTEFASKMLLPFRDLVAEAFSIPAKGAKKEQEQPKQEQPLQENFFARIASITSDMQREVETFERSEGKKSEVLAVLNALDLAIQSENMDLIYGVTVGLRAVAKGCRCIKFLIRELCMEIENTSKDE